MRYQIDPTKVDIKERKRMVFKDFMGVDTLSPVYSISNKRASKMCNFISRDGENHKRYGWKKYLQFDGAINGVFRFTINNTAFSVVYAGTTFWIKRTGIDATYKKAEDCSFIEDERDSVPYYNGECKCYIQNDKAYFIGIGDYIVLTYNRASTKYRFASVFADKDTYIPTTTSNISCEEQDSDANDNIITYSSRYNVEDVNILNPYRKNNLIGSQVGGAMGNPRTYQLDLLDDESIVVADDSSIWGKKINLTIEGYDYNASNGHKTTFKLKGKDAIPIYTKLEAEQELSLDDINNRLYIAANTTMPKPVGYGQQYAISLCKGKYSTNFEYELSFYETSFTFSDSGTNKIRSLGFVNLNVSHGNISYDKLYPIGSVDEILPISSVVTINSFDFTAIEINIRAVFEEAGIDISGFGSSIKTYYIFNQTIDGATYKYLAKRDAAVTLVDAINLSDTTTYGYIYLDTGILQLGTAESAFYARSIAGENNINVTYFAYSDMTNAYRILKSSISITFGIGGNALALFVSGYEPKPHMDWWSKELDYTYFPSGNECANGTANSKVMGYQALGDSSLAIFKEYSAQEPSLYIRSGTDTNLVQSDDGTLSIQTGGYFTSGKYMSKGVIAPKSIAVLQSDPMLLTQDGVCALTIDSNTSSISNRVFRERSRLIDNIIKNHSGKENAVAYVYDGKYFLCIGSDVYIADSRYTFSIKGDMTDTFNYEWWIWDNCPMSYIFENEDGDLCFGTTDGKICKFYKGFEDIDYKSYNVGTFSVMAYSEGMALPTHFSPQIYVDMDGDSYTENILDEYDEEGKEFYLKSNEPIYVQIPLNQYTAAYYDGRKVHKIVSNAVDSTEYELVAYNVEIVDVVPETMVFNWKLRAEDGTETDVGNNIIVMDARDVRFKVHKQNAGVFFVGSYYYQPIDSSLYDAIVEDANDTKWKNVAWGNWYDYAVAYPTRQIEIVVEETIKNVAAYWYTPALDFGTNDYEKTMTSITIATERYTNGQLEFGWETKTTSSDLTSKGMDTFDFNEINFNRIALDTGWNTSYTKFLKCNFNFIMFRFMSDNNIDCCVHQFTIGYKINRKNRGVK